MRLPRTPRGGPLAALLVALAALPVLACADEATVDDVTEDDLTATNKVVPNDVSLLVPLPAAADLDALIPASATGSKGVLVPKASFGVLPPLDPLSPAKGAYTSFRVVGLRVDPCFAVPGAPEAACKNQIRLVLQPLYVDPADGKKAIAADAAIHVFYDQTRESLLAFVKQFLALKKASGGYRSSMVGLHPLLAKEGPRGPFAKGLRELLLANAGGANLSRITFLTREASREEQWKLGGFDFSAGKATPMKIATLGTETVQTVSNAGFGLSAFNVTVTPPPKAKDNLSKLLNGSSSLSKSEALSVWQSALRIENPTKHSPDTMDCASCHLTHARGGVEQTFSFDASTDGNAFTSAVTTKGATVKNGGDLHAFSYKGATALVSQRTVNETAAIVTAINALLAAK